MVRYDATAGEGVWREAWQGVAPAELRGFQFDPQNVAATVFEVRVASADLDSGNPFRDRNARLVTFESGSYPEIVFASGRVVSGGEGALPVGTEREVRVEGLLKLVGLEMVMEVPVVVARLEGEVLRVSGGFDVSLAAFDMRAPSLPFRRVDDRVRVSFDLRVALQPR